MRRHMTRAQQRAMFAKRGRVPYPAFGYKPHRPTTELENPTRKIDMGDVKAIRKAIDDELYYNPYNDTWVNENEAQKGIKVEYGDDEEFVLTGYWLAPSGAKVLGNIDFEEVESTDPLTDEGIRLSGENFMEFSLP